MNLKEYFTFNPLKNKSIFTYKNPQILVNKYALTGIPDRATTVAPGKPGYIEVIDFGEIIGSYFDKQTEQMIETTQGKIHYSKDGVHITPTKINNI